MLMQLNSRNVPAVNATQLRVQKAHPTSMTGVE
jgi:hypothetical protein